MKSATVEICYNGGDHWFRCPDCDSLNINGKETATKCPDCGAEFAIPEIKLCDCEVDEEEKCVNPAPECGVDCHC